MPEVLRLEAIGRIKENKCPACGSEQTSYESFEIEGNDSYQAASCAECGACWTEHYILKDFVNFDGEINIIDDSENLDPARWLTVESRDFGHYVIKDVEERFKKLNQEQKTNIIQLEDKAYRHLISAAEHLLNACIDARDMINDLVSGQDSETLEHLDEVIAAAKGERT